MPIHLLPEDSPTRRSFLGGLAAGGLAAVLGGSRMAWGADVEEGAAAWFAWLSDTHLAADQATKARGQNMAENLKFVLADVLAQPEKPLGMFIDGDLALADGQGGDYRTLLDLLAPARSAKVPIHLALGNHDDRGNFREALHAEPPPDELVSDHHVSVVKRGGLRVVMLDSLQRPNYTPGLLGPRQIEWLGQVLDAEKETPAILFVHHNLATATGALTDTPALLEAILPRKQVKAVVYGHSHRWEHAERDGLHLVNLPAVAYPFSDDQPLGWVRATPNTSGIALELRCVGGDRSKDRQTLKLAWR